MHPLQRSSTAALLALLFGCGRGRPDEPAPSAPPAACAESGHVHELEVPGFPGRGYDVHVPSGYDCTTPTPVVLAIHGGSGNAMAMARSTCPMPWRGLGKRPEDIEAEGCLDRLADRERFIVVYPNGTLDPDNPIRNARTWNAGGGEHGYHCASFLACKQNVDDLAYFNALLDDVERRFSVDPARVYATGISNGAAMSYRLGCELADRIAAIAPVAGADQFVTGHACEPSRPVPLLHIHGTQDSWWLFRGGPNGRRGFEGKHVSVCESVWGSRRCPEDERTSSTLQGWAERNGCSEGLVETAIEPSRPAAVRIVPKTCPSGAEVELVRLDDGGHTWPRGWQYLPAEPRGLLPGVGPVSPSLDANETIWAFFARHPRGGP